MKPAAVYVLVSLLGMMCFFAAQSDFAASSFLLATILVVGTAGYEVYLCIETGASKGALVEPPVLASGLIFGAYYGITNFAFFTLPGQEKIDRLGIDYSWLTRVEALALLGLLAMWMGYRCKWGLWLAICVDRLLQLKSLLRTSGNIRWSVLWACILASVGCRLALVSLGLYGYTADRDSLYTEGWYAQYLMLGVQFGRLALAGLALHCLSSVHCTRLSWVVLYGLLTTEIVFGLLSGFKSQLVIPFFIILGCHYVVRKSIVTIWLPAAILSLPLAFFIVEPFRELQNQQSEGEKQTIGRLSGDLMEASSKKDEARQWEEQLFGSGSFSLVGRLNVAAESARALQFEDLEGLGSDAPPFLSNLLMAPVYAFIPRVIFPEKPFNNVGNWFATEVVGGTTTINSIAIGPVGYLYFAGGALGVGLGFFAIGIVQRVVYSAFWGRGSGALLVYLGLLGSLVFFENTVDSIFISVLRLTPALLVCQYLLFKKG